MYYLLAVLAGAVQGLTEFLPVSSTGHLVIFQNVFKISQENFGLAFDASLHLGTLTAVIIFFAKDYLKALDFKNGLLVKLIIGTIPAAVLGLLFDGYIENNLRFLWIVGVALIAFSPVMIAAEAYGKKNKSENKTTPLQALFIGFGQSIALIPGVSRSGATISAGLFSGLNRQEAARFAFMLSGPIIAGAGAKKFTEVLSRPHLTNQELTFFILGMLSSAVFGYLTIKYFIKYVSKNSLVPFVIYRVILGIVLILASLRF